MSLPVRRIALLSTVLLVAGAVLAAAPATARKAPKGLFGAVAQELPGGVDYKRMRQGDVGTLRISFHFQSVQQVPGTCQADRQVGVCSWTVLDGIVGNAAAAGTRILPTLTANTPPLKGTAKSRWRAFLTAAAKRYGPGGVFWRGYEDYGGRAVPIKDWQVWNEPNSKQFWPGRPNARQYAKLLKTSAKALRKGHKKADVVLAGMFGDAKVPIVPYLHALYRVKRVERHFKSIALHPYAPKIGSLKRQIRDTRRAAKRGGDGKVGMHITELGWSSAKGGHPLMKGKGGQAKMLKKSFRLLTRKRKKWNIEGVSWYSLRDSRNEALCRFCKKSGLLNNSGKPKPAFRAFKKIAR
jgi:polysaccharide biosynthesis protein PslG